MVYIVEAIHLQGIASGHGRFSHEKFNWEVFHLKDNIFRVKLPSKQEVQRLKNFGTYICIPCLSFDVWSVLEDPLYMLPEVWVRVSGLPSDMRSDYLSL
jgi:hypothetical protein